MPPARPLGDTTSRARAIVAAILGEERRLRARHRWLAHQDALGLACLVLSLAGAAALAWAYLAGHLPAWVLVPTMALPLSILHELEHDLIHDLYFKRWRRAQDLALHVIAWAKLTGCPWGRRTIHLHHHRRSGQRDDVEERLIGIGLPFGLYRVLIAAHPIFSGPVLPAIRRASPDFRPARLLRGSLPYYVVLVGVLVLQPTLALLDALAPGLVPPDLSAALHAAMVLWIAPNLLRQGALALVSSYCHYYGDIPEDDLFYQNQILDHWALLPLQALCFGFGATHVIHHFVPGQPFYLRQMVARAARAEMLRQGIRRNDWGVVGRRNRWSKGG